MLVKKEIADWDDIRGLVWSVAVDVVEEIEEQGREEEALDILEDLFNPASWGRIPSETEVNDYIVYDLADHMNLYGEEDNADADDCIDILEQVIRDFQMCSYEEPETDEEVLNKHYYVGNKCHYVGEAMPEFRKLIWTIIKVDAENVWVDFLENLPLRFDKKDVIPF